MDRLVGMGEGGRRRVRRPSLFKMRKTVSVVIPGVRYPLRLAHFFPGYLMCDTCRLERRVEFFVRRFTRAANGHWLEFGRTCTSCRPPENIPYDLHLVRFRIRGLVNEDGSLKVWYARRKGVVGRSPRHQSELQFRLMNSVICPQPDDDRRKNRKPLDFGRSECVIAIDERRRFPRHIVIANAEEQGGLCRGCREPFSCDLPIAGDHDLPWSRGGSSTDPANCVALCGPCNSSKSDRTMAEWEKWKAEKERRNIEAMRSNENRPLLR